MKGFQDFLTSHIITITGEITYSQERYHQQYQNTEHGGPDLFV